MWIIISAALIVTAFVVWGVYGGFSLQISRFFAGQEPLPSTIPGNCGAPVSQGGDFSWNFRTSEPWGACGDGSAATYSTTVNVDPCHPNGLHLVWRAEHRNQASCDIGLAGDSIGEGAGITTSVNNFSDMDLPDGQGGSATMTYTSSTYNCGSVRMWGAFWAAGPESQAKNAGYTGYYKVINYGKDCGAGGAGGGGTTATPVPTPTPPDSCAPLTQSVVVGQIAQLTASGGNGTFQWSVTGGGVVQQGGNQTIGISYASPGQKTVRVNSGTSTAACTVTVTGTPTTTSTPSPTTAGFVMTKTGKNLTTGDVTAGTAVTARTNQTIQFTLSITNGTGAAVTGLTLRDQIPAGMTYYPGSLNVEGQSVNADTITTSGLELGRLEAGDTVTLQWSALANRTGLLPAGAQTSRPAASATTAEGFVAQSALDVVVIGTGTATTTTTGAGGTGSTAGGIGGVSTGPGAVTILSLVAAAFSAFLYAGYTRSGYFRRHELERFSRERDPMDFRS